MLARTALRQHALRPASLVLRTYATAAASTQPPVQLFGLEGSYASALYTASAKASSIENTEKGLQSLQNVIKNDSKLLTVLANPSLSNDDKKIIVETLTKAASLDKTVSNFLEVLAENNRLSILEEVIQKFGVLSKAYHGQVEATVTSAEPLDNKILSRLEKAISNSKFVGKGKTLSLTNKVNPDILGGLIVEVGERTVDLSVSSKIAKLNHLLTESV